MKNFIIVLCIAGISFMGVGCSNDDCAGNATDPGELKEILLEVSNSSISVGESVTFSAKIEGKTLEGVKFYISNLEVTNPYTFNEAGIFVVFAKKKDIKTV
ncbi:hypothetical protein [Myroides pelagicus]|uniref:Uncharacterized protein n=1 Tax=Myroides pelagicus TaxID=270914 RepID=A0A7K1GPG6_9FLAO|nr:hypothetical protein [Myroides pelagicus]MEC4115034.1 hypothetical protein [Myroides pelagicus]MTH30736.1 hypothetical protein [Myroides pelagicus]